MKSILILVILLLFTTLIINAKQAVSDSYNYGDIVVQTPAISNLVNGPVPGYTLNYAISNKIGTNWRKLYNFPDYGLSYNYKSYHNKAELGKSHSQTRLFQITL